jgi:hypothetical protein
MKKTQYITLRIFYVMMVITASLFLYIIWRGGPDNFGVINKLTFTTFVVGLASFLIWVTAIILEVKDRVGK